MEATNPGRAGWLFPYGRNTPERWENAATPTWSIYCPDSPFNTSSGSLYTPAPRTRSLVSVVPRSFFFRLFFSVFFFVFFLSFFSFSVVTRFSQVVERNRALTQDLQRERAERQRVQARLLTAERGAEGLEAESLRDTVAALEVSSFAADRPPPAFLSRFCCLLSGRGAWGEVACVRRSSKGWLCTLPHRER